MTGSCTDRAWHELVGTFVQQGTKGHAWVVWPHGYIFASESNHLKY